MLARCLCAGFLLAACGGEAEQPTPAVVQLPAQTAAAPAAHLAAPSATASVVAVQPGVTPPPAPAVTVFVPEPTITQPPAPTNTTEAAEALVGPHSYPAGVNPLSGLPVADAAVLQRRPLAIKVSNFPRSVRPQSGLAAADIVWEHYAEGGTTRFTAVFYSRDAGRVGSIRSARLIDTTLTEAFAGALVASGMSDGTLERLRQKRWYPAVITESTGFGCPPLCREGQSANAVFASTANIWQTLSELGVNTAPTIKGLAFWSVTPAGGTAGTRVRVHYSREAYSEWRYNAAGDNYLRWAEISPEEMAPHFDSNTGTQLTTENIVVLFANHVVDSNVPEDYAADGIHAAFATEIQLWGSGPALLFRDGQVYSVTWVRMDSADMPFLVDPVNNSVPLRPGKTWFHTTGLSSESAQNGADWIITHHSPYDWGELILPTPGTNG
jgi:hypothetical protein